MSQRMLKVASDITSMLTLPVYLEPSVLVPETSYCDARVKVSAEAGSAKARPNTSAAADRSMQSSHGEGVLIVDACVNVKPRLGWMEAVWLMQALQRVWGGLARERS